MRPAPQCLAYYVYHLNLNVQHDHRKERGDELVLDAAEFVGLQSLWEAAGVDVAGLKKEKEGMGTGTDGLLGGLGMVVCIFTWEDFPF